MQVLPYEGMRLPRWKRDNTAGTMSVSTALWQRSGIKERSRNCCLMDICVMQSVNMGQCNKQGLTVQAVRSSLKERGKTDTQILS
jgi:hypothetical protein